MSKHSDYRQILYVWPWQRLRIILDFTSEQSTSDSIRILNGYLSKEPGQYVAKVWRCLNLASATHMGIRGRIKLHGKTQDLERARFLIESFRIELSEIYASLDHDFIVPTEDQQLQELQEAFNNDRPRFWSVLADLSKRLRRGKTADRRPELRRYLSLMTSVYSEHGERCNVGRAVGDGPGGESRQLGVDAEHQ